MTGKRQGVFPASATASSPAGGHGDTLGLAAIALLLLVVAAGSLVRLSLASARGTPA